MQRFKLTLFALLLSALSLASQAWGSVPKMVWTEEFGATW